MGVEFDKSEGLFPVKRKYIFLSHCAVSPLYCGAAEIEAEIAAAQRDLGGLIFSEYQDILGKLRDAAAQLLRTSPDNLSFVKNTSEGMCMVANGYPFEAGDQIISYVHEYPANHYPWRLQESRGVELLLLPNRGVCDSAGEDRPCGWLMSDLEEMVTGRTKIVAVSHVQFTSGFAAELATLGDFCHARGIDLVVDAAQSLGCLPVYPEECHVAAIAASGWKWLLGPVGTGLLYTSEAFRAKLGTVMVGADLMMQGSDYLNHSWQPHTTGRRFEYSTSPISLAAALEACVSGPPLTYGPEQIRAEALRLQDLALASLDRSRYTPLVLPDENRSGILSLSCADDPEAIVKALVSQGVVCTARAGYLRLAPHFYNADEEVEKALSLLNAVQV